MTALSTTEFGEARPIIVRLAQREHFDRISAHLHVAAMLDVTVEVYDFYAQKKRLW